MTMRRSLTLLHLLQQPRQEVTSISRGDSFTITYSSAGIAGCASYRCLNAIASAALGRGHNSLRSITAHLLGAKLAVTVSVPRGLLTSGDPRSTNARRDSDKQS